MPVSARTQPQAPCGPVRDDLQNSWLDRLAQVAGLLDRIKDNTISGKIAKEGFEAMWAGEGSADEIIEAKGLKQITDSSAIEAIVD